MGHYVMGYIQLLYQSEAHLVPDLIKGSPFKLISVSFWWVPIIHYISYFLAEQDFPGSSYVSLALDPELAILPKNPDCF